MTQLSLRVSRTNPPSDGSIDGFLQRIQSNPDDPSDNEYRRIYVGINGPKLKSRIAELLEKGAIEQETADQLEKRIQLLSVRIPTQTSYFGHNSGPAEDSGYDSRNFRDGVFIPGDITRPRPKIFSDSYKNRKSAERFISAAFLVVVVLFASYALSKAYYVLGDERSPIKKNINAWAEKIYDMYHSIDNNGSN